MLLILDVYHTLCAKCLQLQEFTLLDDSLRHVWGFFLDEFNSNGVEKKLSVSFMQKRVEVMRVAYLFWFLIEIFMKSDGQGKHC